MDTSALIAAVIIAVGTIVAAIIEVKGSDKSNPDS